MDIISTPSSSRSYVFTPHKQGSALKSSAKTIVMNVLQKLKVGYPNDLHNDIVKKTAELTGVSTRSIYSMQKEFSTKGSFSTLGRKRPARKGKATRLDKYDSFTKAAIRQKVHLIFKKNEIPTVAKVMKVINEDPQLPTISIDTTRRIMKDLGFVYNRNVFWHSSSASAAIKDQPAGPEKPTEAEANVKTEPLPTETELLQENEKLAENMAALNDKYKRSLADNENIRTRMRKEIADAKQYGIQGFVKDLVEVADVLGRATESVPKSALDEGNPHLKSLFEGLQMTNAQLLSVLKRHGVAQINPIGEKFNPNLHEALFEQVDESKEAGTVGTVTQVGYSLHDRVVRPAKVGVVKCKS